MRNRKKLEFKTKRHVEKAKKKRYFLIFSIALLLFGAVSTLVLLNSVHFDLSNLFEGREAETSVEETTLKTATTAQGNANFLAMCVSDDKQTVRFICIINADLKAKRIRVATIFPQMRADVEGKVLTLEEHFKQGGAAQTAKAVESLGKISIERYACSTDSGFKGALKSVDKAGKFTMSFAQAINPDDNALQLFIPAGDKAFNGETLLQYLRYLGLESTEDGLSLQAKTISEMLKYFITRTNVENGEALFSLLYNSMEQTNITGFDFNNSKTALESLIDTDNLPAFSVEQKFTLFDKNTAVTTKESTTP